MDHSVLIASKENKEKERQKERKKERIMLIGCIIEMSWKERKKKGEK